MKPLNIPMTARAAGSYVYGTSSDPQALRAFIIGADAYVQVVTNGPTDAMGDGPPVAIRSTAELTREQAVALRDWLNQYIDFIGG